MGKDKDLSRLRKKLEQPSKKTRRSTDLDLRRSLGRRSVGDVSVSDLAAFEQVSSTSSQDSSLHLNPDSAVIDPDLTQDPDWYKLIPPGILASEDSINKAYQQERATKVSEDSNIEGLSFSGCNKNEIHKILNCSVVVDRAVLKQWEQKRDNMNVRASESPVTIDTTFELPQFRTTTLKRGLRTRRRQSSNSLTDFDKVLENTSESDKESAASKGITTRALSRKESEAKHQKSNSSIASIGETPSFRLPQKRKFGLRRPSKKSNPSSASINEFDKVLEGTSGSEEDIDAFEEAGNKVSGSIDAGREATNQNASSSEIPSFELPRRKQYGLRRAPKHPLSDSTNEFDKVLEGSSGSEEEEDVSGNARKETSSRHSRSSEGKIRPSLSKASVDETSSFEVPKQRRFGLRRPSKKNDLSSSSCNEFDKVLEGSIEENVSGNSDKKMSSSHGSGSELNKKNANSSKGSVANTSSFEIPKKKQFGLKRLPKQSSPLSVSINEFDKVLEAISGSEDENVEVMDETDKEGSTWRAKSHSKISNASQVALQVSPLLSKKESHGDSPHVLNKSNKVHQRGLKGQVASIPNASKHSVDCQVNAAQNVSFEVPINTSVDGKENFLSPPSTELHVSSRGAGYRRLRSSEEVDMSIDSELNVSLPLGAEANNLSGAADKIGNSRKKQLSLAKVSSNVKNADALIKTVEVGAAKERTAFLEPFANASKVSANTSVAMRDAPIRISNLSSHHAQSVLDSSHTSKLSSHVGRTNQRINNISQLQEPVEQELNTSTSPTGVPSPKDASFPVRSSEMLNATKLSSKQSATVVRLGKNYEERASSIASTVKENLSQGNVFARSESITATTISLPSNTITPMTSLPTEGSDTVFRRQSSSSEGQAVPTYQITPMTSLPSEGSDSVFTLVPSSSSMVEAVQNHQLESNCSSSPLPPSNVAKIVAGQNESWTENPYVDMINSVVNSFVEESEPFEENLSNIQVDDNHYHLLENLNHDGSESSGSDGFKTSESFVSGVTNITIESALSQKSRGTISGSQLGGASKTYKIGSSVSSITEPAKSIPPSDNASNPNEVAGQRRSFFGSSASTSDTQIKCNPKTKVGEKKLTEAELQQLRCGMKKWMQEIRENKHQPTVCDLGNFKVPTKPVRKAAEKQSKPKVQPKKREPCPYFGDYRPPRRLKPRPYVTAKMYKFLENKLKVKHGVEARLKAEEFVVFMCELVQSTIKKKSKYHKHVFELRDKMVSLGIIKTQFEYHLFIEDYLPDAFRYKSIPCYGSDKAPKLDVDDIHQDLSLK